MFRISKLQDTNEEKVTIYYVTHSKYDVKNKIKEIFDTLGFNIDGKLNNDEYSFSFELNCKLEELLKIEKKKTIDFNSYIFESETFLSINGETYLFPDIKATIHRWLNNKFIILIYFYGEKFTKNTETYFGSAEISFDLDDYIK